MRLLGIGAKKSDEHNSMKAVTARATYIKTSTIRGVGIESRWCFDRSSFELVEMPYIAVNVVDLSNARRHSSCLQSSSQDHTKA